MDLREQLRNWRGRLIQMSLDHCDGYDVDGRYYTADEYKRLLEIAVDNAIRVLNNTWE